MNAEKFFKEMYANIWQGNDLTKFDQFYSKDFEETISVSDDDKNPIELKMRYDDLFDQAKWQKENYKNTTFQMIKLVASGADYISVHFYSSSIEKNTGEIKHRYVCGIWHLNKENKIDRVWAVVTPYYPR
jgi:hypothetical protein